MPATETLEEAKRLMVICNSCRYCEGYCAVFPAMTKRLSFTDADVTYLANLCHGCQGCFYACQYAPPHEFAVNVPKTFAELRAETYRDYAWPGALSRMFRSNGTWVMGILAAALIVVVGLTFGLQDASVIHGVHTGAGAFYKVISYDVMVWTASAVFGFAILAFVMGAIRFQREIGGKPGDLINPVNLGRALHDAATLRFMGGAGHGCNYPDENYSMGRRIFHQLTMWGFLFCFASTSVATIYDHVFGWIAPYDYLSIPVVLGTIGGLGLISGPPGLMWFKLKADQAPMDVKRMGMDWAFLVLLFLTGLTGLLLLAFRETTAMGTLLAIHLGVVLGLFMTLPFGKMVHAVYRLAALIKYAGEQAK